MPYVWYDVPVVCQILLDGRTRAVQVTPFNEVAALVEPPPAPSVTRNTVPFQDRLFQLPVGNAGSADVWAVQFMPSADVSVFLLVASTEQYTFPFQQGALYPEPEDKGIIRAVHTTPSGDVAASVVPWPKVL